MIEEFAVYGLNETMVYLIGGLKILAALGLLIGFLKIKLQSFGPFVRFNDEAIFMHFKVEDETMQVFTCRLDVLLASVYFITKENKY